MFIFFIKTFESTVSQNYIPSLLSYKALKYGLKFDILIITSTKNHNIQNTLSELNLHTSN